MSNKVIFANLIKTLEELLTDFKPHFRSYNLLEDSENFWRISFEIKLTKELTENSEEIIEFKIEFLFDRALNEFFILDGEDKLDLCFESIIYIGRKSIQRNFNFFDKKLSNKTSNTEKFASHKLLKETPGNKIQTGVIRSNKCAKPVLFQFRSKHLVCHNPTWSKWTDCEQETYNYYSENPSEKGRWEFEVRALFDSSCLVAPISFEEAWEEKKKEGFLYGEDALENVKFGYDLALSKDIQVTGKWQNGKLMETCARKENEFVAGTLEWGQYCYWIDRDGNRHNGLNPALDDIFFNAFVDAGFSEIKDSERFVKTAISVLDKVIENLDLDVEDKEIYHSALNYFETLIKKV